MKTNETMTDFRALCQELMDEAIYLGSLPYEQDPDPDLIVRARAALAQPEPQAEMVNCHWDCPPPAPHTSVSDWFNEEGSKGILRGLRISPLPSRGGSRQGLPASKSE